jgi:hypothetical protein
MTRLPTLFYFSPSSCLHPSLPQSPHKTEADPGTGVLAASTPKGSVPASLAGAVFECLAGQKDKLSDQCRKAVESRGK